MVELKLGALVRWSGSRRGGVSRPHEGRIVALAPEGTDIWRCSHFGQHDMTKSPDCGPEFDAFTSAAGTYRDHRGNGRAQRVLVKVENEGSKPHYYAPRLSALEVLS